MNTEQVMKLCREKDFKVLKSRNGVKPFYWVLDADGRNAIRLSTITGKACCARLEHYAIRPGETPGTSIYSSR